jgi:Phosphatidylglycerophosphate synthase
MHKRPYYIVNGITLYRLLSAPLLVYLVLQEDWLLFRWLLVLSFATDAVDGFLARYFHVSSVFGAKLDSIADDLTILVGIFGMLMYRPAFLEQHLVLFLVLLALFIRTGSIGFLPVW